MTLTPQVTFGDELVWLDVRPVNCKNPRVYDLGYIHFIMPASRTETETGTIEGRYQSARIEEEHIAD